MRVIIPILGVCITTPLPVGAAMRNPRRAIPAQPPPPILFDAAAINDPSQVQLIAYGVKGSPVVRAQVLLSRQHFSCGEIDGQFGINLQKAVTAYQKDRRLPVSGTVDPQTWASLNADTAPVLITYTIASEDVAGPFVQIPKSMMQQAKLPALSFQSPLEALGERFHSSPKLLTELNRGKNFGQGGEQIIVPNVVIPPPDAIARLVVVSKSDSAVSVWDSQGKALAWYAATIGSQYDPLPPGKWKITGIRRNPNFHYNSKLFWDAKNPNEKALIKPGANNPVGVVWIGVSKEHYGVHGTPEPSQIGHTTSHGCIRLTNWDAWELAAMVKPGTPALFQE